jgi:hypothetical protein
MKIKLQPNEIPGWIGLMMEAMLSGYLGLHTWLSTQDLCSCLRLCGDPGLPSGIPVMHTIHDPRRTVMNPYNRVGITEYNIHYINESLSLTWPLGQIQMSRRASSLNIAAEHIDSVGSPGHASTLKASDRETILIRTGVVIVSIVLLIVIIIVWPS